jgi:two-component SAPR family response regulator
MKIIAVDDESIALEGLLDMIREVVPDAELNGFEYPEDALKFVDLHECNIAFLDVEMAGMRGVELAEQLKLRNPDINIIFATGFDEYRKEAFDLHASGYLTKPITADKVKRELDDLRRLIPTPQRMRIRTFGNFEVYIDNVPVAFKYTKTKELLAYLVDRKGALCTIGELKAVIFEDDDGHETYMKSLRRDLLETLEAAGCRDVIASQRGKLGVMPERLQCDYYDWCDGKHMGIVWQGEYMKQYSWGEYTTGILNQLFQKKYT